MTEPSPPERAVAESARPAPSGGGRKLVYVATDPYTAFRFMDGQLRHMRRRGFDVSAVTSPGRLLERTAEREGVQVHAVPMERAIAPAKDLVSLWRMVRLFRRLRPDIVFAGTPKGGLLGVVAARCAGTRVVVYHLRGLRHSTATGVKRAALTLTEHVSAKLAHAIVCNSESLRREFVAGGFAPLQKTWVPAHGSSNGVDVERFAATPDLRRWALAERRRLGVPDDAVVVGFVGRFARDKGLPELARALEAAQREVPHLHFLAVGEPDDTDPLPEPVARWMNTSPRVTRTGYVEEPARYYALMDLFAFPSFREGFPNAPLEAAAAGLPTVAFRATGTIDAVVDGETGTLVTQGDAAALAAALVGYATDAALRRRHGEAARARVVALFRREVVWEALAARFVELAHAARK